MSSPRFAQAVPSPPTNAPPAAEFQQQWQTLHQPQLKSFLAERPSISIGELAAVIRVDLRQRWRSGGQRASASDYLTRYPQLLADAVLVVDLIYTEFLVREELGERLHLADLQGQFPQYAAELAAQVEFHQALETSAAPAAKGADTRRPEDTFIPRGKPFSRLPSLGPGYEVLAEIGRGGMGVVYRARQVGLNRLVALKMVRGAEYASAEVLARFRAEAEAVARLHHPHIVQIFDYGEHDGLPYVALELVEGGTLAGQLDGTPWTARRAALLVETLARAVDFAHEQGVIHRDLKPANVLLQRSEVGDQRSEVGSRRPNEDSSRSDLRPLTSGLCPKIADFGLAKAFREQGSEQTQSGVLLGTPSYMAPEQAAGQVRQVGPAADVYALGAMLYELLTGRPPFQGETPIATLQQVLTNEPVPVSLLAPRAPRDLATVCSKCLRREPEQRYRSAAELADDLARHLADKPILARPVTSAERAWRWCRRNPALAGLGGAVALLLLVVAGVSSLYSIRLGTQLQKTVRAEDAERKAKLAAQVRLWDSYLAEITGRAASRKIGRRMHSLAAVDKASALLPEIGRTGERVLRLRNAAIAALALPDLCQEKLAQTWYGPPAKQSTFCSAGDRLAVFTTKHELQVFRLSDGQKLFDFQASELEGDSGISPDGRFVVLFQAGAKVWRIDGAAPTLVWQEANSRFFTFAPGGRHAAVSGANGTMRLLDLDSGQEIRQLGRGTGNSRFAFHVPTRRIAVLGTKGFQVISWDTGELLKELPLPDSTHPFNSTYFVAWHPSGDYLAVGSFAGGTVLLHVASGQRAMVYPHRSRDMTARFLHNGEFLCTYGVMDGSLRLWHTGTGHELLNDATFNNFAWDQTTDSPRMFRWGDSGLEMWEVATASECSLLPQGLQPALVDVHSLDLSLGGRLAAISRSKGLELWDLATGRHWLQPEIQYSLVKFTQNGDLIVSCRNGVTRWPRKMQLPTPETEGSEAKISYGPPRQLAGPSDNSSFAIDPTGSTLALEPPWHGGRVIRADNPEDVIRLPTPASPSRMAVSNDGRWVAVAHLTPGATVFNALTGHRAASLPIAADGLPLFSPDNRWLATSSDHVRVWRVGDWQLAAMLHAQGRTLSAQEIAFSPDSGVLAIGQPNGVIRLIDPATGEEFAALTDPDGSPGGFLAFSPDQSKLIAMAASEHAAPRIWDLAAIRRELRTRGLDWPEGVLRTQSTAQVIPDSTRLDIKFEMGSFLKKQEALDLVTKASRSARDKALALYQQAVQTDPECGIAHNDIAWLLATGPERLHSAEQSLEHARRAVELEPGHQGYLNTLGLALCRSEQYDEAIRVLNRSLALAVDDGVAFDLLFLALAHSGKGDATAAHEFYNKARAWYDDHRAGMPTGTREEIARLLDEARPEIAQ